MKKTIIFLIFLLVVGTGAFGEDRFIKILDKQEKVSFSMFVIDGEQYVVKVFYKIKLKNLTNEDRFLKLKCESVNKHGDVIMLGKAPTLMETMPILIKAKSTITIKGTFYFKESVINELYKFILYINHVSAKGFERRTL